jgi:hypothetical protein
MSAIRALQEGWARKLVDSSTTRDDRRLKKAIASALIEHEELGRKKTLRDEQREAAEQASGRPETPGKVNTAPTETEGQGEAINAAESLRDRTIGDIEHVLLSNSIEEEDFQGELTKRNLLGAGVSEWRNLDEGSLSALLLQLNGLLHEWGYMA